MTPPCERRISRAYGPSTMNIDYICGGTIATNTIKPKTHHMSYQIMDETPVREMVERVSWFRPADYEILMFFETHDIIVSPAVVAANIEYDRGYVNKEFRRLSDADLLENADGMYTLSTLARDFLNGDVSPEKIEEKEPS